MKNNRWYKLQLFQSATKVTTCQKPYTHEDSFNVY